MGKVIISKQPQYSKEYENFVEVIKGKRIQVQVVQVGDRIVLDKYTYLDILYPDFQISEKDLNNNSIVAKLNYNNFSMLFTGDIEEPAEKHLVGAGLAPLGRNHAPLQSTIMKIPHHRIEILFNRRFFRCCKTKNSTDRSGRKQYIWTSK